MHKYSPKTTMELETVSFQVRNLLFQGASIFRWTMLVFGGVHLFMFLEIENFVSECLRLVETQKEWGIFYLYLFTHVHHFFWEGAPTKSAFFWNMINKNSEAKKGFWKRRRNSSSKKRWSWNHLNAASQLKNLTRKLHSTKDGVHFHKKGKFCIFASVHLKRSQIPMENLKIPKQFFTNLGFWFSLPKKFSKFPGPGGERRQRGKGGREWQGAGWIFHWMTPKVLRGSNVLLKIRSVVRKRLICMYMWTFPKMVVPPNHPF